MVSSRDFKILWATNQEEKLDKLYCDNKLALLYFKFFQKKSYWKILGIRLDSQLRKHGSLNQDEQSELKTLYKSDLLYKFLRLNDYVCSHELFPVTDVMRKRRPIKSSRPVKRTSPSQDCLKKTQACPSP